MFQNNYFCPSDLTSGWEYYEDSDVGYLTSSEGAARCSNCDYFPQYDECGKLYMYMFIFIIASFKDYIKG